MSVNVNEDFPVRYVPVRNLHWLYRGEGNANLVISLPNEKIILRMQKCEYDTLISKHLIQQREIKLIRDVQFQKNIMVPLLGQAFAQPATLARISENEVTEIDNRLHKIRPGHRLNKGIRFSLITCHPDYTHLPPNLSQDSLLNFTYCVEIKPKQGWIPPSDRYHPKCTFCGNQYLKCIKQKVLRISQYCPLDLFSGNTSRMKRAIKNLLKTPQNNLKIFKNGNVIYSEDCYGDYIEILKEFMEVDDQNICAERLIEKWSSLLQEALTKPLAEEALCYLLLEDHKEVENKEICSQMSKFSPLNGLVSPCDWRSEPLPESCVLQRILMIQKLQKHNFNTIYKTYRERKDTEEDYTYVHRLLTSKQPLDAIQRYLLAASAKDCSIFIALRRCANKDNSPHHHIKDFDGISYTINIGISDIDPKPLSCIEKHYRRDNEVLSAILLLKHSNVNINPT